MYCDGLGLYLKVSPTGGKSWIQRLLINKKRSDIGLGSVLLVSLAEARDLAIENKRKVRNGIDILADKRRDNDILTFENAAHKVFEIHRPNWKNKKHAQQWISSLEKFAFPHIGRKKIDQVTSNDILHILSPIWLEKHETASRIRQRIGAVMKWAVAKGWRLDNPCDSITQALPKKDKNTVNHQKSLPYWHVSKAIVTIRNSKAELSTILALEFLILTATRSGEVRGGHWDEIDEKAKTWTIPANRMKAKKPHVVPLSNTAMEVIEQAKKLPGNDSNLIFPGTGKGKALSDATLSKLLRELNIESVPHGFRSSFRVWAAEKTNIPREVCEFALAHVQKDKVEAAYMRSDLFEKRRLLMDQWSTYLEAESAKVIPLSKQK